MEVQCQMILGFELGYLAKGELSEILQMTSELGKIINGLRQAVSKRLNKTKHSSAIS